MACRRYMFLKRTNVNADPQDLAVVKEAAKRRGVGEAEIIRQGIHWRPWRTASGTSRCSPARSRGRAGRRPGQRSDRRVFRAVRPLGAHKAFRVLPDDLPL